MMKNTYSQALQDKDVIDYYGGKKNGFFVDAGAFNGLRFSNTYLLEKKYEWKGVCIEPQDNAFDHLVKNRTSICENAVLYSEPKTVSFKSNGSQSAGIEDHLKNNHRTQQLDETLSLEAKTLTSILDRYNCPEFIEYLSIDTEGSEMEVLKGLDLNKYKFGYMTIEINPIRYRSLSRLRRWEVLSYLESYGFCLKKISRGPRGRVLDAHFTQCEVRGELISRQFADSFIDKKIENKKKGGLPARFDDIQNDPSNVFIPRCKNAGKVIGDNVVMHNGLLVSKRGYCNNFSKILKINDGVHEPAEERMFAEALSHIPEGGTIIELGSYWAFYSMWFYKEISNAKVYCIEKVERNMRVGMDNCDLNEVEASFTLRTINHDILIPEFMKEKSIEFIDILHSDIQGGELEMLEGITELLKNKQIRYLFINTHSNKIHVSCLELLRHHEYRIIADADWDNETFCRDGIIVACRDDDFDIPPTSLGNRKHSMKFGNR